MRRIRCAAVVGTGAWALLVGCDAAAQWTAAPDADPLPELRRLVAVGRADRALSQLDALIAAHPDDPRWLFEKGLLLTSQKRVSEAIAVYERLIRAHPTMPAPLNNLGVLYASTGELEKSRAAFERALQCEQAVRLAYANLGQVNLRLAGAAYARALHVDGGPKTLALAQIEQWADGASSTAPLTMSPPSNAPAPLPPTVVASIASASAAPRVMPAASAPPLAAASAPAPRTTAVAPAIPASPVALPASTPQPASKQPASAADTALAREVQAALTAWATSWSRKDVDAYIAAYVPGYKGNEASAQAWQAARRVRILGKSRIAVSISRVAVELRKDNTANASFRQSYAADQLNVSSAKTLEFVKVNGRWLIRREVAGS